MHAQMRIDDCIDVGAHPIRTDALRMAVVAVPVFGQPENDCRLVTQTADFEIRSIIGHRQRSVSAVKLTVAALLSLGAFEIGQQVAPAPARARLRCDTSSPWQGCRRF